MFLFLAFCLAILGGSLPLTAQPADVQSAAAADPGFTIHKLETNVRFDATGTSNREQTIEVKLQSEAAVRQLGVLAFEYDSESERLEVDYVRVRKADGTLVTTPAANIQETPSAVASVAPMYSHLRQMQVPVRSLASGDTLEYKVHWTGTKPQVENQFWFQHDFTRNSIVDNETLSITVPSSKTVTLSSPDGPPQISENGGEKTYTWRIINLSIQQPGSEDKKQTEKPKHSVELTTFRSWEDVGAWYRGLAATKADATSAIRAKSAELTKGLSTDADKEHAIYDFVSTKFRYISISFGVGRSTAFRGGSFIESLWRLQG